METKKFYQKTWFIVLMLLLFAPVGIVLMWQFTNWNKIVKIVLSVIFGLVFVLALIGSLSDNQSDSTNVSDTTQEQQVEEKEPEQKETVEEEKTEKGSSEEAEKEDTSKEKDSDSNKETKQKSELESVSEMGQYWFQTINWDSVFPYKGTKVHYILDYSCKESPDSIKKYGKYVATCSADLTNGFGAEFESRIYIFMDKSGIAKHVFYDEASGESVEIPLDSIKMNY